MEGIMNQQQFDKLYTTIYDAYEQAALKDEYVRSTLGDALDHMILLKQRKLITPTEHVQPQLSWVPQRSTPRCS